MSLRFMFLAGLSIALLVPGLPVYAQEGATELGLAQPVAEEIETPATPPSVPGPAVLFPESYPERLYDFLDYYKKMYGLPVSLGAFNWEHVNAGGPNRTGYGIPPNQKGTYFWYLLFDPEATVDWGPISKVGYHLQLRWREEDLFRNFYTSQVWTWEDYVWVDTPVGRVKAGQIWKRFGLDWDDSFWGNVEYFDGFKLNPDYGLSWENTWKLRDNFKMDSFVQFFIAQDGINGTIKGSESESLPGESRHNNGVVRVVPTWTFADQSTLALGVNGMIGEYRFNPLAIPGIGDQAVPAWCIDATYTKGPIKVFGEGLQQYGIVNPDRYVSGGPSHRISDVLAGIHYTVGPVKLRFVYSAGFDEDPSGWQSMWVPGVTVALTKNIDFYTEYVRWDVYPASGKHSVLEDGWQFVINWRF